MRISDWSSDVCSSDLADARSLADLLARRISRLGDGPPLVRRARRRLVSARDSAVADARAGPRRLAAPAPDAGLAGRLQQPAAAHSLARGCGNRTRRPLHHTRAAPPLHKRLKTSPPS